MDQGRLREFYMHSLEINREMFSEGDYDAAFHVLMAAIFCGERLNDTECLAEVEKLAQEQFRRVDERHPDYTLSSKFVAARAHTSAFQVAALQARAKILQIKTGNLF